MENGVPGEQETDAIFDPATRGNRTLRMTLAYDGTPYCGWQIQPNGVAVQAVVETALSEFTGESTKVVASGRTDAGVHAIGQVISFVTKSTTPTHGFLHGLPRYLPDSVVIRDVQEASAGFNARYDATQKWYRYVIHNSTIRIPFLRDSVFWQRSRLDHLAMHQAAQHLVGRHDFRSFETQWPNRSSSVRTIVHASVARMSGWNAWQAISLNRENASVADFRLPDHPIDMPAEPEFVVFDFKADGFLYNMVRSIVGTLIHVGRGRWTSADLQRILASGNRTHAGETAPPQGLYLMQVDY